MNVAGHLSSKLTAIRNCQGNEDTTWEDRHRNALETIVRDFLPSGSGIDCGTELDEDLTTPERLAFRFSYHHMDENGSYAGWTNHTCDCTASLCYGLSLEIKTEGTSPKAAEYSDAGLIDYLHDTFEAALRTQLEYDNDGRCLVRV